MTFDDLNKDLVTLAPPASVEFNDKIKRMISEGKNIIQFQVGDPDFKTPESIIQKANQFMREGATHYVNSKGLPELRKAVSKFLKMNIQVDYNPEKEIQITTGAVHAYYAAIKAILNPADEVLMPNPTWPTHKTMVEFAGGNPVEVRSEKENNFFPEIGELQNKISQKTKAVVLNSPGNPTGAVAEKKYVEELVNFSVENNLFIISDEVYHKIIYDGAEHISPAQIPGGKERTIVINSLSKTFAMTGWRIGYLAASEKIIRLAQKASQFTVTCAPQFIQQAAAFALTDNDVQGACKNMVDIYSKRRNVIFQKLKENNFEEIVGLPPKGAFYFFLNLTRFNTESEKLSDRILTEAGVALTPGEVFGDSGKGFLRLSFAASLEEINLGMDRFINWLKENYERD